MRKSIINLLLICMICLSAFILIRILENEYKNRKLLNSIRFTYENSLDHISDSQMEKTLFASSKIEKSKQIKNANESNIPSSKPLVIRNEFLVLRKKYKNDDIMGFLKIEGTSINYPVLQAKDNEYYLNRDIQRNYCISGSIFLDCENDVKKINPNTIIYGHNMKDDKMFHFLRYYQQKDFFEKHRNIIYNTIYEDQKFEIFSVMRVHKDFDYRTVNFRNKEQFYKMLKDIKEKSLYETGVEISKNDRILSLSTCVDINSPYRFVVSARLVSIRA